mmetsp:Transcript_5950/g.15818  ORF Transcript_5950/g.15818 Transcript_5950/m.15818 type:complete len:111 (+) Transcript_5950:202-534(+)
MSEENKLQKVDSGKTSLSSLPSGKNLGQPRRGRSSKFILSVSRTSINADGEIETFAGGWSYTEKEEKNGVDGTRSTMRYVAAQSFLNQWFQGKTPLTSCDADDLDDYYTA